MNLACSWHGNDLVLASARPLAFFLAVFRCGLELVLSNDVLLKLLCFPRREAITRRDHVGPVSELCRIEVAED